MRTRDRYVEGLSKLRRSLYYSGDRIGRDHEDLSPSIDVIGLSFDAVWDNQTEHLCTATSHITGEKINRFCHVHQSPDDLHKKQEIPLPQWKDRK